MSRFVYGLSRVMTLSAVAALTLLNWDPVKAITKTHLAKDYGRPALRDVRYLGLDEMHPGQKPRFYTMGIALADGRILWAKPGRGQAAWQGFWRRLRRAEARIQAGAIDMSGADWSAVLAHLPTAALVFDKFPGLKRMTERRDELRRDMGREAEGPLQLQIKGTRFLLLRNPKHLKAAPIPKRDEARRLNEPRLLGWYLKAAWRELWQQPARRQRAAFLKEWGAKASQTGLGQMHKLAKPLRTHAAGILAYADPPITRAKLEGIKNKINTLTKRAYGVHEENLFILKLLSLHHAKYKLLG